jgi:hypothetical protein
MAAGRLAHRHVCVRLVIVAGSRYISVAVARDKWCTVAVRPATRNPGSSLSAIKGGKRRTWLLRVFNPIAHLPRRNKTLSSHAERLQRDTRREWLTNF